MEVELPPEILREFLLRVRCERTALSSSPRFIELKTQGGGYKRSSSLDWIELGWGFTLIRPKFEIDRSLESTVRKDDFKTRS